MERTDPDRGPYEVRVQLGQPPGHHTQVESDSRKFLSKQFHGSVVQLREREA